MESISPLPKGLEKKELFLRLYLEQYFDGPRKNTLIVVNPGLNGDFGQSYVNDWRLFDERGPSKNLIARAQGVCVQCSTDDYQYYYSLNIVFEDDRWKGSTLQVQGLWRLETSPIEWAIVGGTGQFMLAQGIVFGKPLSVDGHTRVLELSLHAFYHPRQQPVQNH